MKKKYFITGFIIILGILVLSKVSINNNKDLAVYIDNELNSSIPANNENLYVNKIDCDNNVNAYWDIDKWGLFISNLSKKTKCNLYFIHDTEKPYWQMESVEKANVLSTDIFEFKIAGTDSLGNVSSNLDISNLSFYVNDEFESPIKVELTKLEELNKKITYSIKVHMVGGAGNLKVKISSGTLTDTSNNQNAEITLDTGINVSKNPAKILHYYSTSETVASIRSNKETIDKYYDNVTHTNGYALEKIVSENFDLVFLNFAVWGVPATANNIFSANINLLSLGNDANANLDIIKTNSHSASVETSQKVLNSKLTYYMTDIIRGSSDSQQLIKFNSNVTVLYKNNTNNIEYDSIGYIEQNGKIWLHSQIFEVQDYIVPMIQFALGQL